MSSTNTASLNQLLLVVNRHYADPGTIAQYGWDFAKEKLQPADSGDSLARFVCAELSDVHDETMSPAEQLISGASYIEKAVKELNELRTQMEKFAVNLVVLEFLVWLKNSKRTAFSEGLVQSWLDVHPLQEVQTIGWAVKERVLDHIKIDEPLTPEILAALVTKAEEQVSLKADLEELMKPEEPPPAPPAEPTT